LNRFNQETEQCQASTFFVSHALLYEHDREEERKAVSQQRNNYSLREREREREIE